MMEKKWVGTAYLCYGLKYDKHMTIKVGVQKVSKDIYQVDMPTPEPTMWIDNMVLKS